MIIVVEGEPASGKTTTCIKLIEKLKKRGFQDLCGFVTKEIKDESGTRTGFEIFTLSGKRAILASIFQKTPYRVGKYYVNVENIDQIASTEIEKFLKGECELIIIDEIGKMEMLSWKFQNLINKLLIHEKGTVVCTLPVVDFHPLVSAFRKKSNKRFSLIRGRFKSEEIAEEIFIMLQQKNSNYQST